MNYKGHLVLGLILSSIFIMIMYYYQGWFLNLKLKFIIQILILIFVSPLVADLDHRHGKLREWVTVIGLSFALVGIVIEDYIIIKFGVIMASIAYLIYYTTKHRGYTHTLWFSCIYGCIIYYITLNIQLGILSIFSYYTHLIGDKLWYRLF